MSRPKIVFLASTLSLLMAHRAVRCDELVPDLPPIEKASAEDLEPSIQWRGTLDETLEVNEKVWSEELRATETRELTRAHRLHLRLYCLTKAWIERHKPSGDARLDALEGMVSHLARTRWKERAHYYRRYLVESYPGRVEEAVEWLDDMLASQGGWDRPLWIDYASERLLALHGAGYLPAGHPALRKAIKSRAEWLVDRGRLPEAWMLLGTAETHLAEDDLWLPAKRAEILCEAGHIAEALAVLEPLRDDEVRGVDMGRLLRFCATYGAAVAPRFPTRLHVETTLENIPLQAPAARAAMAQDILDEVASEPCVRNEPDGIHVSIWRALNGLLHADASTVSTLKALQEKTIEREDSVSVPQSLEPAMVLFRRYPYAGAAHRGLLAAGESQLRDGHAGMAGRCFLDLLSFCRERSIRERALAGLCLATGQAGTACASWTEAVAGIDPKKRLAVFGTRLTAPEIRRRAEPSPVPPDNSGSALAKRRQETLRLPDGPAWAPAQLAKLPGEQLRAMWYVHGVVRRVGNGSLVQGPNLLALYGEDADRPRWVHTGRPHFLGHDAGDRPLPLPAPPRAVIDGGALYCRWGIDTDSGIPDAVAAFELESGRMRWSSSGNRNLAGLHLVAPPAVADGRLYVLAVRRGAWETTPFSLVCLDCRDGRVMWRRLLGHQNMTIRSSSRSVFGRQGVNVSYYGSAVVVRDGEVYAVPNAGFVARCDARDGKVEWVHSYSRATLGEHLRSIVDRGGAPPVLTAGHLILAPRDRNGVFALDRVTGRQAWDCPAAPSSSVEAFPGGRLLAGDRRHCAMIDATSGSMLWVHRFDDAAVGRPVRHGDGILAGTSTGLVRVAATTGIDVGRVSWRAGALHAFSPAGAVVRGIDLNSGKKDTQTAVVSPVAPDVEPLSRFVLEKRWQLTCSHPRLIRDAEQPDRLDRVWVLSAGTLDCLDLTSDCKVAWRSLVRPGAIRTHCRDGRLLLVYPRTVVAYDAAKGHRLWRHDAALQIHSELFFGDALALLHQSWDYDRLRRCVSVVAVDSGRERWRRDFSNTPEHRDRPDIRILGWDGRHLHVFMHRRNSNSQPAWLLCRPGDGTLVGRRPFLDRYRMATSFIQVDGDTVWYMGDDHRLRETRLNAKAPGQTYGHVFSEPEPYAWRVAKVERRGRHLLVTERKPDYRNLYRYSVMHQGDPGYYLPPRRRGDLMGERFAALSGPAVDIIDLATQTTNVACRVPGYGDNPGTVADVVATPEAFLSLSYLGHHYDRPIAQRVDFFDRSSGQHLGAQRVAGRCVDRRAAGTGRAPNRGWREARLHVVGNQVVLRNAHGLCGYRLHHVGASGVTAPRAVVSRPLTRPPVIDGDLADWPDTDTARMPGEGGDVCDIRICHDDANLYLAVSCADSEPQPFVGGGRPGEGDFLDLDVTTRERLFRRRIGVGRDGRVRMASRFAARDGAGAAAVFHDALQARTAYEVAIPFTSLRDHGYRPRKLQVHASVWSTGPGKGACRVGTLGDDPKRGESAGYARVCLASLGRAEEDACLAIVGSVPLLPQSLTFVKEFCRERALSGGYERLCRKWLASCAGQPQVLHLMVAIDGALRYERGAAATDQVAALAARADVPEATIARYRQLAEDAVAAKKGVSWDGEHAEMDKAAVVAALKRHLPPLAGSRFGRGLFEALLHAHGTGDHAAVARLYEWYLLANPNAPDVVSTFDGLWRYHKAAGLPSGAADMEALIARCRLPEAIAYRFRLHSVAGDDMLIRGWQLLGPFSDEEARGEIRDQVLRGSVTPNRTYRGRWGAVRWKKYSGTTWEIDLDAFFAGAARQTGVETDNCGAYAVCWIRSETSQTVNLAVGIDDDGDLWLNRRHLLSHRGGSLSRRQGHARARLRRGWNELLLYAEDNSSAWQFCVELVNRLGTGSPDGIELSTEPR